MQIATFHVQGDVFDAEVRNARFRDRPFAAVEDARFDLNNEAVRWTLARELAACLAVVFEDALRGIVGKQDGLIGADELEDRLAAEPPDFSDAELHVTESGAGCNFAAQGW